MVFDHVWYYHTTSYSHGDFNSGKGPITLIAPPFYFMASLRDTWLMCLGIVKKKEDIKIIFPSE